MNPSLAQNAAELSILFVLVVIKAESGWLNRPQGHLAVAAADSINRRSEKFSAR
jgi:hypothetical protein